jgi:hypothetical protein
VGRGHPNPVIGMRVPFTEIETIFDALKDETPPGRGALTYP